MAQNIARWGTEFIVGSGSALNTPSVAALGVTGSLTGRFVIVYAQGTTDVAGVGDTEAIVAQLYNSDGSPNGAPFRVNSTTNAIQSLPVVIDRVNDEGFAVAWTDLSGAQTGFGAAVRMRLFNANGVADGADFIVHANPQDFSNQTNPSIDRIGTFGTIFVGFDSGEQTNQPPVDRFSGVRGRTYSNATPLQASDFIITNNDPHAGENDFQAQAHVTDLPQTGFLVTWVDNLDGGVSFGFGSAIRGRLYSQLGVPIGTEFTIASSAPNELLNKNVAVGLQNGSYVVGWTKDDDASDGGFERNIYARVYNSSNVGGAVFSIPSSAVGQQDDLALAAYGPDKFIAAWTNQVGPTVDVRARIFNFNGTAFSDEFIVDSVDGFANAHPAIAVLQEGNNPRIVISWRDNGQSTIEAQIFDVAQGGLGIDFFGSARGETYAAQYDEHVLHGNGGDDALRGTTGADTLNGGAGVDTADFSNATAGVTVSLLLTTAQNTGGAGTDIVVGMENIIGSGFADTLTGDAGANLLRGGANNDILNGGDGNDTLMGGPETDVHNGGAGFDTVSYADANAGVTANLEIGLGANAHAHNDSYSSVEALVGSAFNDVLVGKAGIANTLSGGNGDDAFYGEGLDTFSGGAGSDTLFGSLGSALNVNLATAGVETAWGGFLADTLNGSTATANLTLVGQGPAADTLRGGAGDDFVYFRSGDVISGGSGTDWAVATLSAAGVTLNLFAGGFENAWGSTSADTLSAGGAAAMVLVGDAGDDALTGGSGADFIYGGVGNDAINGGVGNDNLVGDAGVDLFRFGANWGRDIVWGWANGSEKFNLAGSGATGFANLTVNQNLNGSGNALISFGANQILAVGGANQIDATDFLFA